MQKTRQRRVELGFQEQVLKRNNSENEKVEEEINKIKKQRADLLFKQRSEEVKKNSIDTSSKIR